MLVPRWSGKLIRGGGVSTSTSMRGTHLQVAMEDPFAVDEGDRHRDLHKPVQNVLLVKVLLVLRASFDQRGQVSPLAVLHDNVERRVLDKISHVLHNVVVVQLGKKVHLAPGLPLFLVRHVGRLDLFDDILLLLSALEKLEDRSLRPA